jgi:peptidoglycan-associated lipoprotein
MSNKLPTFPLTMKNVSKLIGTSLAAFSLLLTACTKKPIRAPQDTTQTGSGNGDIIDPTQVAVAGDPLPSLTGREGGTVDSTNTSVVDAVYFALDRYAVAPAERSKLDAAIKWLAANPEKHLVLIGHCDWRGTAEYNLGLGENRANSVKRYLVSLGADASRLETLSKGSTEAKQGGSESEWAKDRRVDFIELKKQ